MYLFCHKRIAHRHVGRRIWHCAYDAMGDMGACVWVGGVSSQFHCTSLLSCGGVSYGKEFENGSASPSFWNAVGLFWRKSRWKTAEDYWWKQRPSRKLSGASDARSCGRTSSDGCRAYFNACDWLADRFTVAPASDCQLYLPDDHNGWKNHALYETVSGRTGRNEPWGSRICTGNIGYQGFWTIRLVHKKIPGRNYCIPWRRPCFYNGV